MQFDKTRAAAGFDLETAIKAELTARGIDPDAVFYSEKALTDAARIDRLESDFLEAIGTSETTDALTLMEQYMLKRFDLFALLLAGRLFEQPFERAKTLQTYKDLLRVVKSTHENFAATTLRHFPEDEKRRIAAGISLRLTSREKSFLAEAAEKLAGNSPELSKPAGIQISENADDDFTISGKNGKLRREPPSSTVANPVEGFRSFTYRERQYFLTVGEGKRVEVLWKRFKGGNKKVAKLSLKFYATDFKPSKVFSTEDGKLFWDQFIRSGSGKYWIEIP